MGKWLVKAPEEGTSPNGVESLGRNLGRKSPCEA